MAWTSAHFATGMIGGGAIAAGVCLIRRRGWAWLPLAMTVGGAWAFLPDMPRFFREDFPSLPFASILGDKALERRLHAVGDLFFFHAALDRQPHQYALHGLFVIVLLYTLTALGLALAIHRQRARLRRLERHLEARHRLAA